MLTRDAKPLIVSMGDVAASGGYYIAAPADAIVAEPGTITGSIGVVTGKFVMKGTLRQARPRRRRRERRRDGADLLAVPTVLDRRAERGSRRRCKSTYDLFVSRVAEGRQHAGAGRCDAVAQGRVWTGAQAKARGLVDEIGGLDVALRLAKERAKLDPTKGVSLVVYPQRRSLFEALTNPFGTMAAAQATAMATRPELRAIQRAVSALSHFRRGEMLALLPNVFVK